MLKKSLVVLLLILLSGVVSAFGVTRLNSLDNPVRIMPGESGQTWIEYQNLVGGETVNADYIDYLVQNLLGDAGKVGSSTTEKAVQGEDPLDGLIRDLTYRKVYREGYVDSKKKKEAEK